MDELQQLIQKMKLINILEQSIREGCTLETFAYVAIVHASGLVNYEGAQIVVGDRPVTEEMDALISQYGKRLEALAAELNSDIIEMRK